MSTALCVNVYSALSIQPGTGEAQVSVDGESDPAGWVLVSCDRKQMSEEGDSHMDGADMRCKRQHTAVFFSGTWE